MMQISRCGWLLNMQVTDENVITDITDPPDYVKNRLVFKIVRIV